MLSRVSIKNFKSLRSVAFEAKRVNLFIGEPNTGKSNLVEALAFFSPGVHQPEIFKEIFRFRTVADLFWDQDISKDLSVETDVCSLTIRFESSRFTGSMSKKGQNVIAFTLEIGGEPHNMPDPQFGVSYYSFKPQTSFSNSQPGRLNPPYGNNLVAILYSNKTLRQSIGSVFRERGFRLEIKPMQYELLVAKEVQDELYSYQWESVSETLRRIVFYKAALETNQNAVLLLDEPESNTFPFYTKYLAERIALDESNQFFIATHNPYLLGSIVAKAAAKDIGVFVTRMENFETRVDPVSADGLPKILDLGSSVFFNLERLLSA